MKLTFTIPPLPPTPFPPYEQDIRRAIATAKGQVLGATPEELGDLDDDLIYFAELLDKLFEQCAAAMRAGRDWTVLVTINLRNAGPYMPTIVYRAP